MTSDTPTSPSESQDGPDEPVWGAPAPRRGWSKGQTLAALGVAVVIAAFGGAAIYAATDGGSNEMGPGRHGPGPGGPGRWDGSDAAIHGEFVVRENNGGYTTVLTQTGVLTATSDTSITAKSSDGFMQTYTIAPDSRTTKTQLAVNDTVIVRATLANGTATVTMVSEDIDAGPDNGPPHRS